MSLNRATEGDLQQPSRDAVDIWMIRDNLKLSPEERVIQHQNTLDFIDELKQVSENARAKSSSPPQVARS